MKKFYDLFNISKLFFLFCLFSLKLWPKDDSKVTCNDTLPFYNCKVLHCVDILSHGSQSVAPGPVASPTITWKCGKNANFQAPLHMYWIRNSGVGAQQSVKKISRWFWYTGNQFENHWTIVHSVIPLLMHSRFALSIFYFK